jgi:Malectin domain
MGVAAQLQFEKAELDSVLQSGIFSRAPNLSNFLTYICNQHFNGTADQIKEYNIAVEALGRPADFDQKKDSIVRVEAHRLRKSLSKYYATAGAGHTLRIEIPNGQYAPVFIVNSPSAPEIPVEGARVEGRDFSATEPVPEYPATEVLPSIPNKALRGRSNLRGYLSAAIIAAVAIGAMILFWPRQTNDSTPGSPVRAEVWKGSSIDPVASEFRMLAGYRGQPFIDRQGHKWEPDSYFNGGHSLPISPSRLIEGLPDPSLLHGFREGDFRYDIPLRAGTYELHLFFAETSLGKGNPSEGDEVRSFDVKINGLMRLELFDALSEAGAPNRLQVRVFKDVTPDKDGKLHLEFIERSGLPILNALEILSSVPGKIRPIRMVAQKIPVMDGDGRLWAADEYVIGGHLVERTVNVSNDLQKNLFHGERFGNFSYHLPVAPGKYTITLHFAETYFGSGLPNAPPYQKGARLFDVFANGTALLRDFDVTEAAGGTNRAIARSFSGLEPNAQGLIVLEFSPSKNYACINAIEVEQTQ